MKGILFLFMFIFPALAFGETETFDKTKEGSVPPAWLCGVTGKGTPKWEVQKDSSAPTRPHVLKQSGEGTYPWCVKKDVQFENGYVEAQFKSISGNEDQAGGLVWRWKDSNNYYVARANALENNVSLYRTTDGKRITLKYVDAPVAANQWHTLRVEFKGTKINVLLNSKKYIELEDDHIRGPGAAGVWTKADSVTAFDDFSFGKK